MNSFFELISFGLIIPLISIIIDESLYFSFISFLQNQNFINIYFLESISKKDFLILFITVIFVIYLFKFLINIVFNYYLSSIKVNCEKAIGNKIIESFSITSNFSYLNVPISKLLHDITARLGVVSTTLMHFGHLFVEIIIFSTILIFILVKNPLSDYLLFMMLFLVLTFLLFFLFYKKKAVEWSLERGAGGDARNKNLLDFLEGIREIIIYSKFKKIINEYKKNNESFLNPLKKILFWNSVPRVFLEMLFMIFFLSVFFYYVFFDLDYVSMLLSSSVLLILFLRILPSLNRILYNYSQIKYATEPICAIHKLLNLVGAKSKNRKINLNNKINLENVTFSYIENHNLIQNLSVSINKNFKVGIIGETGSGKSTLVDLISGLKLPKSGSILIDGEKIDDQNKKGWMENIAYIPQRVFLFNASLRHNICLQSDDENIDDTKFNSVLKIAGLTEFVKSKTEKELFNLGEFGKNVSGGQRQKIGIARALYSERPIVIFDETTNSLDKEAERKIINEIENIKNKTILFITHNVENLKNFDEVYKIQEKKLIEFNGKNK